MGIFLKIAAAISATATIGMLMPSATATTFTKTSPTSQGSLPVGISEVGGIVLDLVGTNGTRVVSQLSAGQLFQGWTDSQPNPLSIGTQAGFDTSVLSALGGSLKEAAIRFTLYDGDTASGNFDYNDNFLLLNGINFGNWSAVNAQATDASGNFDTLTGFSNGGFRDSILDTGWFYSNDASKLASFWATLTATNQVVYQLNDIDPGDQYLDFKQGIASSLLNVSQLPTVQPPTSASVPEPSSMAGLLALGALGMGAGRRKTLRN